MSSESIRETLRGRHILVTGFTGFVAKVWVAMLLDRVPEIGRISLLVRPRREETAVERVRKVFEQNPCMRPLREKHGDDLLELLRQKIEVVEGDARQPLLGIDPYVFRALAPQLDAVVHCAGITSFSPDPIEALAINVRGAEHAADVAARIPDKRLVHISTCFVAGEVDGEVREAIDVERSPNGTRFDVDAEKIALESACRAVDEREGGTRRPAARRGRIEVGTRRARALGWPNLYTYSKGLGEHSLARREDIALSIVRPSIVECAREFPFPGWNEGLNTSGPIMWMCAGFAWKVPMRADNTFDIVPVDTVAKGMTIALADSIADRAAPVYQLASGDHQRLTFDRALDLTALEVRRGYTPSGVSRLERALLTHLDTTTLDHGADRSVILPAAKKATGWLRDTLRAFDPERHLPRATRAERREEIGARLSKTALSLNKTSMLLKSIEQLWLSYQPFIHDHDYRFVTRAIRERTAQLDDADRAAFGWDLESMCWRHYWMKVEMPGLDRWSLPLLRGKSAPVDTGFDLGGDPIQARAEPSSAGGVRAFLGGAE